MRESGLCERGSRISSTSQSTVWSAPALDKSGPRGPRPPAPLPPDAWQRAQLFAWYTLWPAAISSGPAAAEACPDGPATGCCAAGPGSAPGPRPRGSGRRATGADPDAPGSVAARLAGSLTATPSAFFSPGRKITARITPTIKVTAPPITNPQTNGALLVGSLAFLRRLRGLGGASVSSSWPSSGRGAALRAPLTLAAPPAEERR